MIIFQGSAKDFGLTFVIGALGYAFYYMANRYLKVRFLQEFLAKHFWLQPLRMYARR
ncbi:hypothetical protein MGH68_00365 [Erysipelothrix sp. D19-032]